MKTVAKSALALAACCVALFGCNKKSNAAASTNSTEEAEWAFTHGGGENENFKLAEVPDLTTFTYTLSDVADGVKITRYAGGGGIHVRIPDEIEGMPVVELGDRAFSKKSFWTIVIPDSVKVIGNDCFSECTELVNVKLPKSLEVISSGMFYHCDALGTLVIPDGVMRVEKTFSFSGIRSLALPDSVTELGMWTFDNCRGLEHITLSKSLRIIPERAFSECHSLVSLEIPEGVTEIGEKAFADCALLQSLVLPNTLTTIRANAFAESAYYQDSNGRWLATGLKSLVIPDSVTMMEASLCELKYLETLHLSDSLTEITDSLLHNTYGTATSALTSVNLPKSVQKISNGAFSYLKNLREIDIPDSLTAVEFEQSDYAPSKAFYGTALNLAAQKRLKELGYSGQFN